MTKENIQVQQSYYLKMTCVRLMIIMDDKVLFIPNSTTLAPKLIDFNVLFLQYFQVVGNLFMCSIDLKMIIQSLSTSIEMNSLETT
jgi:hypothetical protein